MPVFELRVCGARNLPPCRETLCAVVVEGKQWRTAAIQNDSNPEWNEVFKFALFDPDSSRVHFGIRDESSASNSVVVGEYELILSSLQRGVVEDKWVALRNCKSNAALHIRVKLSSKSNSSGRESSSRPTSAAAAQPTSAGIVAATGPPQTHHVIPLASTSSSGKVLVGLATPLGSGSTRQDVLHFGRSLSVDQHIESENGRYRLLLQGDGNLVLYEGHQPHWASHTCGLPVTHAELTNSCFALFNGSQIVWKADCAGADCVKIQNDRNIVAYRGEEPLWASNTQMSDSLLCGHRLDVGRYLDSADGRFRLLLQGDGNLVLYEGHQPHWASHTCGLPVTHAELTNSCFDLFNGGQVVWKVDCSGADCVKIQNDRNVVAYRGHDPLWASNTRI